MKSCSLVLLAGGLGTRMKSSIPKSLHKICGKELIFYSLTEALKLTNDIHIIVFHKEEELRKKIGELFPSNNFTFHRQDFKNKPGTAGALMHEGRLIPSLREDVVVLNADMPLISNLDNFISAVNGARMALSYIYLDNPAGYGRLLFSNSRLSSIIEDRGATGEFRELREVNAGLYFFKRSALEQYLGQVQPSNAQGEYYLTDVFNLALASGQDVRAIKFSDPTNFMGVNDLSELASVEEEMLRRLRTRAMKGGVRMIMPSSIYLDYETNFEGECLIEPNAYITNSHIKSSIIKASSIIDGANINNSSIGPFARIRPGSIINDSMVGNFVEVKNSTLNGVKAGHLSYLGDAFINEGTNIGAGCITCNYDGFTKHQTSIGKNVFIGSGCNLVAPLTLPSNVFVAAGSTVTDPSNEDDLIIARARQVNKRNFVKKLKELKGNKKKS